MPTDSVVHRLYTLLSHSALLASTNEPDNRRQIGRGNSKFKIQNSEFQGFGEADKQIGGELKIRGFNKLEDIKCDITLITSDSRNSKSKKSNACNCNHCNGPQNKSAINLFCT